ncbi:DUF4367 domain-containing protein [Paenibacillus sp. IHBB 10380]|uniref:DUF4367 domain-containing protein n=1 Tax=Paenibacillus sp. IHBB 10380 TaxID=1566358 RepID=UPI0005CFD471|nr:DUF4367 domain-containing protein [Paenibacillus sp. IHBB 10380]AJS61165.1 hypothetical protein UB51_25075 [Paenibacillus sp. IHBB 10380]
MNSIHDHEDQDMKELVTKLYNDIVIPNPTPSWNKVRIQLEQRRKRKKWLSRVKLVSGIVAASLLVNILVTGNMTTYAKVAGLFRDIQEQVIEIFFQNSTHEPNPTDAKTPPPVDSAHSEPNTSSTEIITLEEANSKLSFPLLLPTYVPDSFRLDHTRISKEADGEYTSVYLGYVSDRGDSLKVTELELNEQTTIKMEVHAESGTIEEIQLGDNLAILVATPEGYTTLEWLSMDRLKITISGNISTEEIIKVGTSMQ